MAPKPANKTLNIKLVLLGDAAVGKSSLVLRFVHDDFQENKESTIGAAFLTQKCEIDESCIKFEIWDTAGQERFHSLAPMYYRNAQVAIIVYDVTELASMERAKKWIKELRRQVDDNVLIVLAGNKCDLEKNEHKIDFAVGMEFAAENGLMFFETSAKCNINVQEMFTAIAKKLISDMKLAEEREINHPKPVNTVDLSHETEENKSACMC